jgi:hypothetical protein
MSSILLALSSLAVGWGRAEPPLPALELSSQTMSTAPSGLLPLPAWIPSPELAPFRPEALASDGLGRLFALDRGRGRIVRIDPVGGARAFSAGEQGGARFAQLIALFAGNGPDLFALDPSRSLLYQFDLDGRLRTQISYGAGADGLGFIDAVDFALDKSGELLLLDRSGSRLLRFDRFGRFLVDLARGATGSARLESPTRLGLDGDGDIYVLDPPGAAVRRFSRQGDVRPSWRYDADLPDTAAAGSQLAVTPWNQVVVAARDASWIRVFARDGLLLCHQQLESRSRITDLVVGPDSLAYLAEPAAGRIDRFQILYDDARARGR